MKVSCSGKGTRYFKDETKALQEVRTSCTRSNNQHSTDFQVARILQLSRAKRNLMFSVFKLSLLGCFFNSVFIFLKNKNCLIVKGKDEIKLFSCKFTISKFYIKRAIFFFHFNLITMLRYIIKIWKYIDYASK